jgi:hypothetical protein
MISAQIIKSNLEGLTIEHSFYQTGKIKSGHHPQKGGSGRVVRVGHFYMIYETVDGRPECVLQC